MTSPFEVADAVVALRNHAFESDILMKAIGLSPPAYRHLIHRVEPMLCSETAGQGRPRQFTLFDIYQLSLLAELTNATRKAEWSARALDAFAFGEGSSRPSKHVRETICSDIEEAPPVYWTRGTSISETWIMVADRSDIEKEIHRVSVTPIDRLAPALQHSRQTVTINATGLLHFVDARLMKLIKPARRSKVG